MLARHNMKAGGFTISTFLSLWFVAYIVIRTAATFGQLYSFSQLEVGRSLALFSASSLVLVNVLSVLLLGEVLSVQAYVGVLLAVTAFTVISVAA